MVAAEVGVTYKWLHWGRGWSEWLQLGGCDLQVVIFGVGVV